MNTFSHGNRKFNPLKRVAKIWPQIFVFVYNRVYFTLEKIAMSYKTKILMRKDAEIKKSLNVDFNLRKC